MNDVVSHVRSLFVPPRLGVQGTARPTGGARRSVRAAPPNNTRQTRDGSEPQQWLHPRLGRPWFSKSIGYRAQGWGQVLSR